MRLSYFLHLLIEGRNKDGPDIEKNFLGEDEKGAERRMGGLGADDQDRICQGQSINWIAWRQ